jgi:hypothetical protein
MWTALIPIALQFFSGQQQTESQEQLAEQQQTALTNQAISGNVMKSNDIWVAIGIVAFISIALLFVLKK